MTHSFIFVVDLQKSVDFYTNILGFDIHTDILVNGDRWVTLMIPEQPDLEILLVVVEEGMIFKNNQVKQMRSLLEAQTLSFGVFECTNLRGTYEELKQKGVEFFLEPYLNRELDKFEAGFFDNSGNWFRLTEIEKA